LRGGNRWSYDAPSQFAALDENKFYHRSNMQNPAALIAVSVAVGLLGCDTVTLDAPIGERLTGNEIEAFVGRWTNNESEVVDIRLTKDGQLVAGSLSWDEGLQRHVAQDHTFDARHIGPVTYFLFHDDDDAERFGFVRVYRTDNMEMKMYRPNAKRFRAAVQDGQLDGTLTSTMYDHFNVHIRVNSQLPEPFFADAELGEWYDDEGMQTFRSIKRFDSTE